LLTPKEGPRVAGTSEIVVATLDERGVRDQFAWSSQSLAFMDRETDPKTGALAGTPRDSGLNVRMLRIPVPADVNFLFFYASECVGGERFKERPEVVQRPMGLYFTGAPGVPVPPLPPLPIPFGVPPIPWRLPFRPPQILIRPFRPKRVKYLAGSDTLVSAGDPADCFDIVILGDGFSASDLAEFDARAAALANGLIAMPPFDALASKINIHAVRAVSLDSGISQCPAGGGTKSTYFDVKGNFNGQYAGFVGTNNPERIYQAAELIAPREHLEVFLVIANCDIEGGSAFPQQRLAFITMYADMTKFVNFAAHELAHVLAGTCEEYIGCVEDDPLTVYPNQVTDAQRAANAIPWLSLAVAGELTSTGVFRAQHVLGDPLDNIDQPIVAAELKGMLGAYWGCQDIAIGSGFPGDMCPHPYSDPRGAGFFRPMAECRMRRSRYAFCRVCAAKLTEAVLAVAP
jgi:hypothetical protein